jgi:prophage regulatory protein
MRLVGAHEIRIVLGGISRQRVYQLTMRADFPAPVADLALGKVWLADDVDAWDKARRPAPSPLVDIGAKAHPVNDVMGGAGPGSDSGSPRGDLPT